MNTTRDDTRRRKILAEISNPRILAALDDYARIIDEEIREHPLRWAPCYEALNASEKETGAFSDDGVQWSVCGMLLAKMSSQPYGTDTLVARNMAQRLLGLIAYRMLNYEDPELFFTFATDGLAVLGAGGSHINIHRVEHEIGLVGVQDVIAIFRKRMPELQSAVAATDLTREYSQ